MSKEKLIDAERRAERSRLEAIHYWEHTVERGQALEVLWPLIDREKLTEALAELYGLRRGKKKEETI